MCGFRPRIRHHAPIYCPLLKCSIAALLLGLTAPLLYRSIAPMLHFYTLRCFDASVIPAIHCSTAILHVHAPFFALLLHVSKILHLSRAALIDCSTARLLHCFPALRCSISPLLHFFIDPVLHLYCSTALRFHWSIAHCSTPLLHCSTFPLILYSTFIAPLLYDSTGPLPTALLRHSSTAPLFRFSSYYTNKISNSVH